MRNIKEATEDEIMQVPGMTRKATKEIYSRHSILIQEEKCDKLRITIGQGGFIMSEEYKVSVAELAKKLELIPVMLEINTNDIYITQAEVNRPAGFSWQAFLTIFHNLGTILEM